MGNQIGIDISGTLIRVACICYDSTSTVDIHRHSCLEHKASGAVVDVAVAGGGAPHGLSSGKDRHEDSSPQPAIHSWATAVAQGPEEVMVRTFLERSPLWGVPRTFCVSLENCQTAKVFCFVVNLEDLEKALQVAQNLLAGSARRCIRMTGSGSVEFGLLVNDKFPDLNVRLQFHREVNCILEALEFLMCHIPGSCFRYAKTHRGLNSVVPDEKNYFAVPLKEDVKTSLYPFLLVNLKAGVSFHVVTSPNSNYRVGGSTIGGATFMGLLRLLCPSVSSPLDAFLLAQTGDNSTTDMLVSDIYGGDYPAIGLKGTTIASTFGKMQHAPLILGNELPNIFSLHGARTWGCGTQWARRIASGNVRSKQLLWRSRWCRSACPPCSPQLLVASSRRASGKRNRGHGERRSVAQRSALARETAANAVSMAASCHAAPDTAGGTAPGLTHADFASRRHGRRCRVNSNPRSCTLSDSDFNRPNSSTNSNLLRHESMVRVGSPLQCAVKSPRWSNAGQFNWSRSPYNWSLHVSPRGRSSLDSSLTLSASQLSSGGSATSTAGQTPEPALSRGRRATVGVVRDKEKYRDWPVGLARPVSHQQHEGRELALSSLLRSRSVGGEGSFPLCSDPFCCCCGRRRWAQCNMSETHHLSASTVLRSSPLVNIKPPSNNNPESSGGAAAVDGTTISFLEPEDGAASTADDDEDLSSFFGGESCSESDLATDKTPTGLDNRSEWQDQADPPTKGFSPEESIESADQRRSLETDPPATSFRENCVNLKKRLVLRPAVLFAPSSRASGASRGHKFRNGTFRLFRRRPTLPFTSFQEFPTPRRFLPSTSHNEDAGRAVEFHGTIRHYSPPTEADVARSILTMMSFNVAQLAFFNSLIYNCPRIFLVGYYLEMPGYLASFQHCIDFWSRGKCQISFVRMATNLGALGASLRSERHVCRDCQGHENEESVPIGGFRRNCHLRTARGCDDKLPLAV